MDAWVLTLQGRGDEVKTPYAWDSDPLAELGKNPTMEHNLAARRVRGMGTVGFAGLLAVDVLLKPKESRTLCIPGKYVQDLRETVLAELAENDPEDRWVSEGDVLLAVWARGALAHLPKTSSKTVSLLVVAFLRTTRFFKVSPRLISSQTALHPNRRQQPESPRGRPLAQRQRLPRQLPELHLCPPHSIGCSAEACQLHSP